MKYFLGFLGVVALVILVFVLVLRGFKGSEPKVQTKLADYAQTETIMRMTVDGPVTADQSHYAVRITVGRSANTIDLIQGYEGNVLQTKTYGNNEAAYTTFLRALQLQGYTKGNTDSAKADSRGYCPNGRVFSYEVITGSATVQHFWKGSCGGGTFGGNETIIRQLFRNQIPDYTKVTRGTGL